MIGILIITILLALVFDVMNGFHDAANSIATIVSTQVLKPYAAVIWAACFNFLAMFIFAPKVADTISKIVKIEAHDIMFVYVIASGLLGATLWDVITWWLGLPTSSSHALIGGLSGAGFAYTGWEALRWDVLLATIEFIFIAPVLGFLLGFLFIVILYWICRAWTPAFVDRIFRKGQFISAALYSIGHGANDAQKTMGVILAVLIAGGYLAEETTLSFFNLSTAWIILSCQFALSLGTALGGWRIVKTMGMKMTKLKPIGGFCAETAGAITLFIATHTGIPVSTTHTITGSIMGVGSAVHHFSKVNWGIATRIIWAWILTIPASALVGAVFFKFIAFILGN